MKQQKQQFKTYLLLALHVWGCFVSNMAETCNAGSGKSCAEATLRDHTSLLMKAKPEVISRDRPALAEVRQISLTLGNNEYIINSLTQLPASMGSCETWMTMGGCKKWQEFVVCGKTEEQIYDSLKTVFDGSKADVTLANRVIIGNRSNNSPKATKILHATGKKCHKRCTDAKHKWQKKGRTWAYKCTKPVCRDCMQCNGLKIPTKGKEPYVSAQPVGCTSGTAVQFLVNRAGNIGAKATAKAVKALLLLGLKQPFSCATENWMRTRMSEMLEQYPSPLLLNSFPDVQDSIDQATSGLLQEAAEVAKRFSHEIEDDEEEDDDDDGDYTTEGQQHGGTSEALLEQEEVVRSLAEIKAKINATEGNIYERMLHLKRRFGHDHGIAMGPRFIRMTFHDAADYRNLISGNGVSVCNKSYECGGVDFRLHTNLLSVGLTQKSLSLTDETDPDFYDDDEDAGAVTDAEMDNYGGETPIGNPNHNRGLTNAIQWVRAWSNHQSVLGKADIMVLGAHVAVETWLDGPEMPYRRGRVDADHVSSKISESEYCTHEDCQGQNTLFLAAPVAEPVSDGMFCPATSTLAGLQEVLNLTTKEVVALQGSHSIGGIIRCSGMGNTAKGPFCGGVKCCPPGMKEENGACVCRESDCRSLNIGMNGASFDGTPNKLDNMYYKQLDAASYEEIPECNLVANEMPGMMSGDQKLFICMKKKGYPYKASEGNSTWDAVVKHGCASSIKRAYSGGSKEQNCRNIWKKGGSGVTYPKRDWCSVDACMDNCAKKPECGEKSIQEIGVLMSRYQNKDYGKVCTAEVYTTKVSEVQAVIDAIKVDLYKSTNVEDDVYLIDKEGVNFSAKGMKLFKATGGKVSMKSVLQRRLDDAPKKNGELDKNMKLIFTDPEDPKCNQCTLPACATDALDALENALGMVKPDDGKSIADWLNDALRGCKECKLKCLTDDAQRNGPASNKAPEWCLERTNEAFCARGGATHECPGEHKYGIPNHADGRRTLIWNTLRWTRFRGQTRRVAMMPADWAQLGNATTRQAVKDFAGDNDAFKTMWGTVFQKVSEAGMSSGAAQQCSTDTCLFNGSAIICADALNPGIGLQTLTFDQCDGGFQGISPGTSCTFKRNFAVSGVFTCGTSTTELYCSTERARNNYAQAKKELDFGGDHDTCYKDDFSMLDTDVSASK
mmetsp:Transcript_73751/g.129071  ORF Transcript_73751/g.129071 Transcript_73751/m.129071 type:complete len:1176 (-) Transcript_73751:146-3673(-)